MSAITKTIEQFGIFQEIESHPSWSGNISGIAADLTLRKFNIPYLFMIRQGEASEQENVKHYYVSFLLPSLEVKHQPLMVQVGAQGWTYRNFGPGGPYSADVSIDDVLHLIMHCEQGQNTAFIK